MPPFRDRVSLAQRLAQSERVREKYPTHVPVVVERGTCNPDDPAPDKEKFLVPGDVSAAQFVQVVRKSMKMTPEQAIFLMIDKSIIPMHEKMCHLHERHKTNDGFMYVTYCFENVFG